MKMPIPDDWDGETWLCTRINWPDSIKFRGILQGILIMLARGRYWDERTGTVTGAQQIGREIWYRNFPLVDCDGNEQPTQSEQPYYCGGDFSEISDDEWEEVIMSAITKLVWGSDGKLYAMYGECCKVPVAYEDDCATSPTIGDMANEETVPDIEEELPDFEPPSGADYACLKATALVKTFEDLLLAGQTVVGMVNAYEWDGYLQEQLPYLSLTNWECAKLGVAFQALERIVPLSELVWTTEDTEWAICKLKPAMNNDSLAMTADEFDAYYKTVSSVGDLINYAQYTALSHMIDKSQYRRAIAKGIFAAEADCSCPEIPAPPEVPFTTIHFTSLKYGSAPGGFGWEGLSNNACTVQIVVAGGSNEEAHYKEMASQIYVARDFSVPITEVTFAYEPIIGNYISTADWNTHLNDLAYAPDVIFGNLQNNDYSGAPKATKVENGMRYVRFYNGGQNLNWVGYYDGVAFSGRFNPDNYTGTHRFKLHIVSVNNVATGPIPYPTGW